jgi:pyruvate kinase
MKKSGSVTALVIDGGILKNKKGINLPDSSITANPITKKDNSDLKAGLSAGVDFVAISFVRCAADIRRLRQIVTRKAPHTEIIAKIERHEAVNNIEAIISEADGVMIARGDLGVELPAEKVPVIQLKIVQLCHYMSKPVIIATQMLESMIVNPRPTRAELSDVGNSVRFYVDAMMLSAETATGNHPLESVVQMSNTAVEMENYQHTFHRIMPWEWRREQPPPKERALAYTAARLLELLSARAIIVISETGFTVKRVASPHPNAPIFAFTPHEETMRKLALVRNVLPFQFSFKLDLSKNLKRIFLILKKKKLLKKGDRVIVISGLKMGVKGSTEMVMVEDVT